MPGYNLYHNNIACYVDLYTLTTTKQDETMTGLTRNNNIIHFPMIDSK